MLLSVGMMGGCATILRGTHQEMVVRTVPGGASVDVAGKEYTSPAKLDLARKDSYVITISKPGYRTIEFHCNPEFDGVSLIGNMILPGGSIGLVADHLDGAEMNFYELATIKLVPATQPSEPPLLLRDFQGHLLTDAQYTQAVDADRLDRSRFFRGEP